MSGLLNHLGQFLQHYPGNLTYHLVILFLILAVYLAAGLINKHSRYLFTKQMRAGLLVLFGAQLVMLLVALITQSAQLDSRLLMPATDRFVIGISLVWIAWLWISVHPARRINLTAIIVTGLLAAFWVVTLIIWIPSADQSDFNASGLAAVWNGLLAFLALAAAIFLFRTRQFQWHAGFAMFVLILIFSLLQFTSAGLVGDYPGFIRFGLLAAFPLLMIVIQRLFPPPLNEITKDQVRLYGDRRRFSAELQTLQDWLNAANQSSYQALPSAIAKAAAQTMLADFCYLLPLPKEQDNLIFLCGYDSALEKELPGFSRPQTIFPTLSAAVRLAEPFINNVQPTPDLELDSLADLVGLRNAASLLYIPLAASDTNWGGMLFLTTRTERAWTEVDTAYGYGISKSILDLLKKAEFTYRDNENQLKAMQKELADMETAFQQVLLELNEYETIAVPGGIAELADGFLLDAESSQQAVPVDFIELGEDQAVGQELQLALTEMGHLQEQLTEARERLVNLEAPDQETLNVNHANQEVIALTTRKLELALNSLSGKTDLLLSETAGDLNPVQGKFLQQIKSDTDRIQVLLEEIFRFSGPVGILQANAIFDLPEIIDQAVAESSNVLIEKNCSVQMEVERTLPLITGNQEIFSRIISQLVHNAVTASLPNGTVRLDAGMVERAGEQVLQLKVTDSGTGVSPEDFESVFSPSESDTEPNIEGLGDSPNDLHVTRSLVDSIGGSIIIESAEGEGTTFLVTIPLTFSDQQSMEINDEDQE